VWREEKGVANEGIEHATSETSPSGLVLPKGDIQTGKGCGELENYVKSKHHLHHTQKYSRKSFLS
jgi:hypothetical protein